MFKLQILDTLISEDEWYEDLIAYLAKCRAVVGDLPMDSGPVWVYGVEKPPIKSRMSYIHQYIPDMAPGPRDEATYLLYVTPGEEIVAGMMISDIPPDTLQDQTEK